MEYIVEIYNNLDELKDSCDDGGGSPRTNEKI